VEEIFKSGQWSGREEVSGIFIAACPGQGDTGMKAQVKPNFRTPSS
jgi:hypothetical protein